MAFCKAVQVHRMWGRVVVMGEFGVRAYKVMTSVAENWVVGVKISNNMANDMLRMVAMDLFMVVSMDVHRMVIMVVLRAMVTMMVMMSMTGPGRMRNVMKLMMLRNGARMSVMIVKVVDLRFYLLLASCQIHRLTTQKLFDCLF